MSLEEVLRKAVERINSGSLTNEAEVKEWVIRPILHELDWNDPAEFRLEFPVDNGWVDYALLGSGGPLVFIEAKGLGRVGADGEEQVFGYAAHRGVPFLLLTDGNLWDFYLSMAEGVPDERRFYRAELTREERIPEYVEFFETYFRKSRIVSGDAYDEALKRHRSNRERNKANRAIPNAWRTLVEHPSQARGEMLRDLLVEEVESQCGTKPDLDDVEMFLKGLSSEVVPPSPLPRPSKSVPASTASHRRAAESDSASVQPKTKMSIIVGFVLDGKPGGTETSIGNLAEILKEFSGRESGFMERFAEKTMKGSRPLVSKDRDELYARPREDRPQAEDLENGWWLQKGIRATTKEIKEHIEIACEVAGVKFGTQLKLRFNTDAPGS